MLEDLGDTLIPLFHKNGENIFVRHFRNKRRHKAVVRNYISFFLKNGYVKDGRVGRFVAVPTSTDRSSWTLELMSGAILMEMIYTVISETQRTSSLSNSSAKAGSRASSYSRPGRLLTHSCSSCAKQQDARRGSANVFHGEVE